MNNSRFNPARPSLTARRPWRPAIAKHLFASALVAATVLLGAPTLAQETSPAEREEFSYSQLLTSIEENQVSSIEYDPEAGKAAVTFVDPNRPSQQVEMLAENDELIERVRSQNVEFDVTPSSDRSAMLGLLVNILLLCLLFAIAIAILRRSAASSGQALNFGKSRARFQMEAKTGIVFDDVAGIAEAKEELREVVSFLKETERFTAIGARIPKGVLLIGPPGTGKTLLAKAVAGEAGVPFFSISGSEFVEMFVGVGASRVRDLFKKAKENAPCLVFIDEIDAVGRQRGAGIGGGNDEREQTLNQLLTEMDGFEGNTGVIVVAATNRPDVLDTALLRPGRFDRQINVDLPDRKGRLGILEVHARTKKISADVSLELVSRRTPGFSGADLANLLNEAAILTARRRKDEIEPIELDDAIDRITIGMSMNPLLDSKKKRLIAYHEVGHALLATLLDRADPLNKVTIIPRSGGVGGFSQQVPDEEVLDSGLISRAWLLDFITLALGGRAAEEEVFGHDEVTSGATNDVATITRIARRMVTQYGMSELGQLALEQPNSSEVFLGGNEWGRSEYSEEIAAKIDRAVREIVMQAHAKARQVIRDNRHLVDRLVDLLLERETVDGDEFRRLVAEHATLPEKQREFSLA